MASLYKRSQQVVGAVREGICWIALWKKEWSWEVSEFCPEMFDYGSRSMWLSKEDIAEIQRIMTEDKNAILVNGYYSNLGDMEHVTIKELNEKLRWQYFISANLLADWEFKRALQAGEYVLTPRFLTVKLEEVFDSESEAKKNGYTEPTHTYDIEGYSILGKSLDMHHMEFAAAKI